MVDYFRQKIVYLLSGLLVSSLILVFVGLNPGEKFQTADFIVNFFDVGQGDAALIKTGANQYILIDGGPDTKIIEKLGERLPPYQKKLDLVILTHPHADHVTGLVEVLERYQVDKIFFTGQVHTAPDYIKFLEIIKEKQISAEIVFRGEEVVFDEKTKMKIFWPPQELTGQQLIEETGRDSEKADLNETSIISKIIFQNTSFLFTGDAGEETEKVLLAQGADLSADVLKIGHHGSASATSKEFLKAAQPQFAVISAGKKNKFGHPSQRVLRRLERIGVQILRTDQDGDIQLGSDGEKVWRIQ